MQAPAFTQSLIAYSLHVANAALARSGAGRDAKAVLLRHAANMSEKAKIEADVAVIAALSGRFNIKATKSERPEFCGLTFAEKADPTGAARQALRRARAILRPSSLQEAEEAIAKMVTVKSNSVDPVAALLTRFSKLTGGQKRSFLAQLRKA